jgi:hypothetical protein
MTNGHAMPRPPAHAQVTALPHSTPHYPNHATRLPQSCSLPKSQLRSQLDASALGLAIAHGCVHLAASAGAGAVFGAGLLVSGMTSPAKVAGFLSVGHPGWNASCMFVMAAAIGVSIVASQMVRGVAVGACGTDAGTHEMPRQLEMTRRSNKGDEYAGRGCGGGLGKNVTGWSTVVPCRPILGETQYMVPDAGAPVDVRLLLGEAICWAAR